MTNHTRASSVAADVRHILSPVAGLLICLSLALPARAEDPPAKFDSPEAAVKALMEATKAGGGPELRAIFGTAVGEFVSGDEVQDRADLADFARRLAEANRLAKNDDGSMSLYVGRSEHPFLIPIVSKDGKWFFDTAAGKEELLNRRVGENELSTIAVCRAYVVAQREYARADHDGDNVLEYASRIASTPGARDGLFWEAAEGDAPSPLGPLVAEARAEGYGKKGEGSSGAQPSPYHGYLFKLLTAQGAKAPGGKFDYSINGNMVAGFALAAYPVEYGSSGVMTFLVNANGRVLEKDLGEKTAEAVSTMSEYDPDDSWSVVKE